MNNLVFKNLEDLAKWKEYKINKINVKFYLKQKQNELKNKDNELKKLAERYDWYFEQMNNGSKNLSYKTFYEYFDKSKNKHFPIKCEKNKILLINIFIFFIFYFLLFLITKYYNNILIYCYD